jgi:hypothetical protein
LVGERHTNEVPLVSDYGIGVVNDDTSFHRPGEERPDLRSRLDVVDDHTTLAVVDVERVRRYGILFEPQARDPHLFQ